MSETTLLKSFNSSSEVRRGVLLRTMGQLKHNGITCAQCPGTCCTFVANSMQVTPVEALDMFVFLRKEGRINQELRARLKENIREFRLDSGPHVGAGRAFRRTYTCPFFKETHLGCSLTPESKPYGCLAFNASKESESSGKSCSSDRSLLEERELALRTDESSELSSFDDEDQINSYLREHLKINWLKESIPVALMDFIDRLETSSL